MSEIRYTKSHEWIRVDGTTATVGITTHAAEALAKGKEAAVVESVKAASEIYAPVSGTVTEGNTALSDDPAIVNRDAMGDGWFFKMTVTDAGELADLMDQAAYDAMVAESH